MRSAIGTGKGLYAARDGALALLRARLRTGIVPALALAAAVAVANLWASPAHAVGTPKLAAPIYPGAVPALQNAGLHDPGAPERGAFGKVIAAPCVTHPRFGTDQIVGAWCFLSKDSAAKVKAYYEKALGPLRVQPTTGGTQSYVRIQQELRSTNTNAPDYAFAGVSVSTLAAPEAIQGEGLARQQAYMRKQHFINLAQSVDWMNAGSSFMPHKPQELDALYAKYGRVDSSFYVMDESANKRTDEILHEQYAQKSIQLSTASVNTMASAQQERSAAVQQQIHADHSQDDAEIQRIMAKNPALAAKMKPLREQQQAAIQRKDWVEAQRVSKQMYDLAQTDPELAAFIRRKQQEGQAQDAAAEQKMGAAQQQASSAREQSTWGVWVDYLKASDKIAYPTLIVIDDAIVPDKTLSDQKFITNSKAADADAARQHATVGPDEEEWGLHLVHSAPPEAAPTANAAPANAPQQAAAPSHPKHKDKTDEAKDTAKKAMDKGLNALKKFF